MLLACLPAADQPPIASTDQALTSSHTFIIDFSDVSGHTDVVESFDSVFFHPNMGHVQIVLQCQDLRYHLLLQVHVLFLDVVDVARVVIFKDRLVSPICCDRITKY